MKTESMVTIAAIAIVLAVVGGIAKSTQDEYTLELANGLANFLFKGSKTGRPSPSVRLQPAQGDARHPTMIGAYRSGIPGNGSRSRRLQDREDRVEAEKDGGGTFFSERARHLAGRFLIQKDI